MIFTILRLKTTVLLSCKFSNAKDFIVYLPNRYLKKRNYTLHDVTFHKTISNCMDPYRAIVSWGLKPHIPIPKVMERASESEERRKKERKKKRKKKNYKHISLKMQLE